MSGFLSEPLSLPVRDCTFGGPCSPKRIGCCSCAMPEDQCAKIEHSGVRLGAKVSIGQLSESISRSAYGFSLAAIWQHLGVALSSSVTYEERVSIFFLTFAEMLGSGRVRVAAQGKLCDGDIPSQITALKRVWPSKLEEDQLDGFGLWFLTDCPVGVVWVDEDGDLIWT